MLLIWNKIECSAVSTATPVPRTISAGAIEKARQTYLQSPCGTACAWLLVGVYIYKCVCVLPSTHAQEISDWQGLIIELWPNPKSAHQLICCIPDCLNCAAVHHVSSRAYPSVPWVWISWVLLICTWLAFIWYIYISMTILLKIYVNLWNLEPCFLQ